MTKPLDEFGTIVPERAQPVASPPEAIRIFKEKFPASQYRIEHVASLRADENHYVITFPIPQDRDKDRDKAKAQDAAFFTALGLDLKRYKPFDLYTWSVLAEKMKSGFQKLSQQAFENMIHGIEGHETTEVRAYGEKVISLLVRATTSSNTLLADKAGLISRGDSGLQRVIIPEKALHMGLTPDPSAIPGVAGGPAAGGR